MSSSPGPGCEVNEGEVLVGVVVDDATLTLDELACACGVEVDWLHQRLNAGLLACCIGAGADRRGVRAEATMW